MGLVLTTDLRQDYQDNTIDQVQEVYRDPFGNVVRFTVVLHSETKNQGTDFAVH